MTESNVQEVLVPITPNNPTPIQETVSAAPTVDKPAEENPIPEPAPPQEDPKFAARFAALSRKEKELLHRERSFKENQSKLQQYEKALQEAKTNPIQYLQAAGLTLEEAIQKIINDETPNPNDPNVKIKTIEDKIKQYEDGMIREQQRQQEVLVQQQTNQVKSEIFNTLSNNSEQYELILTHKAIDDVFNVMFQTWNETNGKVKLTIEQAAQAVEDELLKEEEENAARLLKLNKLKSKFQSPSSVTEIPKVRTEEKVSKISPTLTNQSVSPSTEPKRFKSREESLAEAAKLLKWK